MSEDLALNGLTPEDVNDILMLNDTNHLPVNKTATESTPLPGVILAYGCLLIMAIIPVYIGSFKSIQAHRKQLDEASRSGEKVEIMSNTDAAFFPIFASGALFGLYFVFQLFPKDWVNNLLSIYFVCIGIFSVTHCISPLVTKLLCPVLSYLFKLVPIKSVRDSLDAYIEQVPFNVVMVKGTKCILDDVQSSQLNSNATDSDCDDKDVDGQVVRRRSARISTRSASLQSSQEADLASTTKPVLYFDKSFTTHDIIALALATIVGLCYAVSKHWITNNTIAISLAANGIEMLHLNNVLTGCILLGGLFVYDVFWVFGTDVMVTVAKSFDAPIKLVFPQDLLVKGLEASNMAMLGLGDIVIPGIFIALLLRYDFALGRKYRVYFWITYIAYISALLATICVMHFFKHAQPALLYIVPACVLAPTLVATIRGDLTSMMDYADHPEEEQDAVKKDGAESIDSPGPVTRSSAKKTT